MYFQALLIVFFLSEAMVKYNFHNNSPKLIKQFSYSVDNIYTSQMSSPCQLWSSFVNNFKNIFHNLFKA